MKTKTKMIAKKRWNLEQIRRCREGHNGMSGKHYYYFNFWHIKSATGAKLRPTWRSPRTAKIISYIKHYGFLMYLKKVKGIKMFLPPEIKVSFNTEKEAKEFFKHLQKLIKKNEI